LGVAVNVATGVLPAAGLVWRVGGADGDASATIRATTGWAPDEGAGWAGAAGVAGAPGRASVIDPCPAPDPGVEDEGLGVGVAEGEPPPAPTPTLGRALAPSGNGNVISRLAVGVAVGNDSGVADRWTGMAGSWATKGRSVTTEGSASGPSHLAGTAAGAWGAGAGEAASPWPTCEGPTDGRIGRAPRIGRTVIGAGAAAAAVVDLETLGRGPKLVLVRASGRAVVGIAGSAPAARSAPWRATARTGSDRTDAGAAGVVAGL
jgi:hypothetical protein